MSKQPKQQTFVVRVLKTQHKTWQGTITWLDNNNSQPFRSLLEMINLMDSALGGNAEEESPEEESPEEESPEEESPEEENADA